MNITPTLIEFPSDTKVAAGQEVLLNCTFSTSSQYHYWHWYKDGKNIPLILENPNCRKLNNSVCRTDVRYPDDHSIWMSNIRSYTYSQSFCLQDNVHRHANLVIDRAELGDAGKYTCKLFGMNADGPLQSATVTLQVGESTWQCHGNGTNTMVIEDTQLCIIMTCTSCYMDFLLSCLQSDPNKMAANSTYYNALIITPIKFTPIYFESLYTHI